MRFEDLYNSPLHDPGIFLVAIFALLVVFARRLSFSTRPLPFFTAWCALFVVEITLDCLLTGALSPWANTPTVGLVAIPFVILGDARYFLLVERYSRPAAHSSRAVALALAQSFVVPVCSIGVQKLLPQVFPNVRWLFLLYESEFLLVALAWRFLYLPPRLKALPPSTARWLRELTHFELAQYALWIAADVVILLHHDAGFGLRLLPNFMYYAVFLPFAFARAPREITP